MPETISKVTKYLSGHREFVRPCCTAHAQSIEDHVHQSAVRHILTCVKALVNKLKPAKAAI